MPRSLASDEAKELPVLRGTDGSADRTFDPRRGSPPDLPGQRALGLLYFQIREPSIESNGSSLDGRLSGQSLFAVGAGRQARHRAGPF